MQPQRLRIVFLLLPLLSLIWLAAKVAHGGTTGLDQAIRGAIHSLSSPWLTRLFSAITFLGSQACVLALSACAAILLLSKRHSHRALFILVTMAGAELWLAILKAAFHRPRPEPFFGAHLPLSYSFPSGHALLSCCCYGVLAVLGTACCRPRTRWLIRLCAALLILAIGVSRIYLGVHYPSDVMAGYLVAIVWMAALATMET